MDAPKAAGEPARKVARVGFILHRVASSRGFSSALARNQGGVVHGPETVKSVSDRNNADSLWAAPSRDGQDDGNRGPNGSPK